MASRHGVVAWYVCAGSVLGCGIHATLLVTAPGPALSVHNYLNGLPIIDLATVAAAAVGALILSRYPSHRIGWLFTIDAFGTAIGLAAGAYGSELLLGRALGPVWSGQLAAWVAAHFSVLYVVAFCAALFLLVPDGRVPSRRWRPVLGLVVLGLALHIASVLSVPPARIPVGIGQEDLSFGPVTEALETAATLLLAVALPLSAVALFRRLRRARGEQRQQLRWIATSAVGLAAGVMIAVAATALSLTPGDRIWIAVTPLYLAYASLPVCTGVAIFRYRLYDVDVIINRAFVLLVLAAFVTAGYVAVVVGFGAIVGRRVDAQFWPSLLATAVVAMAFQPLRKKVLWWADRLVYGERAAPYEALADFSRQIGAAESSADALPLLAETAGRTVGARCARVHVDVPGTAGLSASWPAGVGGEGEEPGLWIAVRDRGEQMGTLSVTMPPGRAVRRDEQRLLARFAEQAGLALRNVRLEAELRARVDEAAQQSTALDASRRRLLGARDAERQRVAATINRTVLAHLEPMIPALESARQAGPDRTAEILVRCDAATRATLDALREVTHGVFPAVLSLRGLVPALRSHLAKTGLTDVLQVQDPLEHRRFDPATEVAAYFCCLAAIEAIGRPGRLALALRDGLLDLEVSGPPGAGADSAGEEAEQQQSFLHDRVEAVGGRVRQARGPDGVLVLRAELPAAGRSGP